MEYDGSFGLRSDQSDDGGGEVIFTVSSCIQFKDAVVVVVVATGAAVSLIRTYFRGDQLYTILAIILVL